MLEPTLHGAATAADENHYVAETVGRWLSEPTATRPDAESVGVLVRTNRLRDEMARALRQAGVTAVTLSRDSETTGKGVQVATMHRAKGMEFSRVVVAGASASLLPFGWLLDNAPDEDRAEVEQRERLLLYVACTRARDQLVVSWNGKPSPFLPVS